MAARVSKCGRGAVDPVSRGQYPVVAPKVSQVEPAFRRPSYGCVREGQHLRLGPNYKLTDFITQL